MDTLNDLLRPRALRAWRLWLLVLVLALIGGVAGVHAYRIGNEVAQGEQRYQQLLARSQVKAAPPPSRAQLEEAKRWAALHTERQFPWYPIFVALEQSTRPGIELLEFQPDKASQRVVLRGEAQSRDALIDYIDSLSKQAIFTRVYLKHQKNKIRERMTTVTFEIHTFIRVY